MALASTTVWEARSAATGNNGGGFDSASGGIDSSQQDAAFIDFIGTLSSPGAGSTTITDSSSRFTSGNVGNTLSFDNNGSFVAGYYQVTAFISAASVTLDRSATPSVTGVSGSARLGGALFDPKSVAEGVMVAGNRMWLTGSFSASTRWNLPDSVGTALNPLRLTGYNTVRGDATGPAVTFTHTGSTHVIRMGNNTANNGYWIVEFIDGINGSSAFFTRSMNNIIYRCRSLGATLNAFNIVNPNNVAIGCEADDFANNGGTRAGFRATGLGSYLLNCIARNDNSSGASRGIWCDAGANAFNCISVDCNEGFYCNPDVADVSTTFLNCTAYANASHGFSVGANALATVHFLNCLASSNGGYGLQDGSTGALINILRFAHFGNSSGGVNTGGSGRLIYPNGESNDVLALAAEAMVDPANADYRIKGDQSTMIEGGFGDFLIGAALQNWRVPEIGAVQRPRHRRRT